jgi:HEAT repeat protein
VAEFDNFEALLNQLRDGLPNNPDAQWQAAIELGNISDPQQRTEAVNVLITTLSGTTAHALTRAHAAESLGRLGDARALPGLRAALDDSYRLVRAYAAGAISRLDSSSDEVDVLLNRLSNDTFFGVRAEAAAALGNIAANSTDQALRQRIQQILQQQLTVEQANPGPGVERVIADIERALQRLP